MYFPTPQVADPFQLFMARLLGERFDATSEGVSVTVYRYNGQLFVTAVVKIP